MRSEIVVIAVKRTIRQYRKGNKVISKLAMRELESVLKGLKRKRTYSQQAK